MNVFDFDNTLYDGESTLDFYFYCVKHHPKLIRFVFVILYNLAKYKMLLITPTEFERLAKKYVGDFLFHCPNASELAEKFWQTHIKKLNSFYESVRGEDDAVISASFGFLLAPIMSKMGIKKYVCSEVDFETGKVGELCFGANKTLLFNKYFPNEQIDDFYTDSLNDLPMMKMARGNVYLVKNNNVRLYNVKENKYEK